MAELSCLFCFCVVYRPPIPHKRQNNIFMLFVCLFASTAHRCCCTRWLHVTCEVLNASLFFLFGKFTFRCLASVLWQKTKKNKKNMVSETAATVTASFCRHACHRMLKWQQLAFSLGRKMCNFFGFLCFVSFGPQLLTLFSCTTLTLK